MTFESNQKDKVFDSYMEAFSNAKKREFEEGDLFKVKHIGKDKYEVVRRQKKIEKIKKQRVNVSELKRNFLGESYSSDEFMDLKIKEISNSRRPKNVDWKNTYCDVESGNVRYSSSSKRAVYGWAYIFTKDEDYVYDLSFYRKVQVKEDGRWSSYQGYIPREEDFDNSENTVVPDEWLKGYDY